MFPFLLITPLKKLSKYSYYSAYKFCCPFCIFRRCCFFLSLNIYRLLFHREFSVFYKNLSSLHYKVDFTFDLSSLITGIIGSTIHFFFVIVHFSLDQRSQYLHQNRQRVYLLWIDSSDLCWIGTGVFYKLFHGNFPLHTPSEYNKDNLSSTPGAPLGHL